MSTNGNHATTQTPSWSALLASAASLEEIKQERAELYKRQRYLETLQAILEVAPFDLEALRAAEHDDNGVIIVDGLALRHMRQGERFPDEPRESRDLPGCQKGLYILWNLDGLLHSYTHGHQVNSLLDIVVFLQQHAGTPAVES